MDGFDNQSRCADMDAQIADHVSLLLALREQRNSITITYQLPPEILGHIFVLYMQTQIQERIYSNVDAFNASMLVHPNTWRQRRFEPIPWITITQICSHWRSVALECPHLWAPIFLNNLTWTKELLKRSKDGVLHVAVDPRLYPHAPPLWPSTSYKCLKAILPHLHRVKTLDLNISLIEYGTPRSAMDAIHKAFRKAQFPELQILRLKKGQNYPHIRGSDDWSLTFVKHTLSQPNLSLKLLAIKSYPAHVWEGMICHSLVTLSIIDCPLSKTEMYYPLLENLPSLESLTICRSLSSFLPPLTNTQPIHLFSLSFLKIDGSAMNNISRFLHVVKFPTTAILDINSKMLLPIRSQISGANEQYKQYVLDFDSEIATFVQALSPFLFAASIDVNGKGKKKQVAPFKSLGLGISCGQVALAFSRDENVFFRNNQPTHANPSNWDGSLNGLFHRKNIQISLVIHYESIDESDFKLTILSNIQDAIQDIQHLFICEGFEDFNQSNHQWVDFLGNLPRLKMMDISLFHRSLGHLFRGLDIAPSNNFAHSHSDDWGIETEMPRILFLSLETLVLRKAVLKRRHARPRWPQLSRYRGSRQPPSVELTDDDSDRETIQFVPNMQQMEVGNPSSFRCLPANDEEWLSPEYFPGVPHTMSGALPAPFPPQPLPSTSNLTQDVGFIPEYSSLRRRWAGPRFQHPADMEFSETLEDILKARYEAGLPLRNLFIMDSVVEEETIDNCRTWLHPYTTDKIVPPFIPCGFPPINNDDGDGNSKTKKLGARPSYRGGLMWDGVDASRSMGFIPHSPMSSSHSSDSGEDADLPNSTNSLPYYPNTFYPQYATGPSSFSFGTFVPTN